MLRPIRPTRNVGRNIISWSLDRAYAARTCGGGGRASRNDPHGRGGPNGPTHSPSSTVNVSVGMPEHDAFFDAYMSLVKWSALCVS